MRAIRWMMASAGAPLPASNSSRAPAPGEVIVEIAGCGVCHTDLGYLLRRRPHQACPAAVPRPRDQRPRHRRRRRRRSLAGPGGHRAGGDPVRRLRGLPARQGAPSARIRTCPATTFTAASPPMSSFRRAASARSIESAAQRGGLELADVSVVADAVTTPYQAVVQAGVKAGDLVIVNGVGGVGGYCAQIAHALGATVVAIDVGDDKLERWPATAPRSRSMRGRCRPRELKAAIQAFAKARGLRDRPNGASSSARAPAPARRPPSACSIAAPRSASSASPWTRSRSGCRT